MHWQKVGPSLPDGDVSFVTVDPTARSLVYAGFSADGVFRSPDAGRRWIWANQGLRTFDITRVVPDPERPGTVCTGPAETGVYKSTDAGRSSPRTPSPSSPRRVGGRPEGESGW
jgi:hypothetical protein